MRPTFDELSTNEKLLVEGCGVPLSDIRFPHLNKVSDELNLKKPHCATVLDFLTRYNSKKQVLDDLTKVSTRELLPCKYLIPNELMEPYQKRFEQLQDQLEFYKEQVKQLDQEAIQLLDKITAAKNHKDN